MIKLYLFLIFAFSIFLLGITVGHYEIFPFSELNKIKDELEFRSYNLDYNSYPVELIFKKIT